MTDFTQQPQTSTPQEAAMQQQLTQQATAAQQLAGGVGVRDSAQGVLYQQYVQRNLAQQDAQNDYMKQVAAFSQPRDDLAFAHSSTYDSIIAQYGAQHYATVGSGGTTYNPQYQYTGQYRYDSTTAAGIAAEVYGRGGQGAVAPSLALKAIQEGFNPSYISLPTQGRFGSDYAVPINRFDSDRMSIDFGQHTIQIQRQEDMPMALRATPTGEHFDPSTSITTYVPFGTHQQIAIEHTKDLINYNTGEIAIYQGVRDINFGGNYREVMPLVGGGGRNALQSGMFTYGQTEVSGGNVLQQWAAASYSPASKAFQEASSRLGAEAYGGFSGIALDSRTIESTGAKLSTYANPFNLANFANPQGPNMGREEAPGSRIPYSIGVGGPSIQFMNENGIIPGIGFNARNPVEVVSQRAQEIMPGVFATGQFAKPGDVIGVNTQSSSPFAASAAEQRALPMPFVSTAGVAPSSGEPSFRTVADNTFFGGGLIGKWAFGDKSAEVIRGFVSASVDTATFGLIKLPSPGATAENPYGEFSKWGTGAGESIRGRLGFTQEQLSAYEVNLNSQQVTGVGDIWNRVVFGAGKAISTHPEMVIANVGAGAIYAGGGEVVGGLTQGTRIASALASPIVHYGVPTLLVGATAYSATGGFTLPLSKSLVNIGGTLPGLGGMLVGGIGAQSVLRSSSIGFGFRETASDTLFSVRQKLSGIERVGPESGLQYHVEEPYAYTAKASASALPSGSPYEIRTPITDIVPVKFIREVRGEAYDITRANAGYTPGETANVYTARDIFTVGDLGKIEAIHKTNFVQVDVGEYGRQTGVDIGGAKNKVTFGETSIFKTETVRDIYSSGITYENVIGKRAVERGVGVDISGVISSRGIEEGQGPIFRTSMANADVVLQNAMPEGMSVGKLPGGRLFELTPLERTRLSGVNTILGTGKRTSLLSPEDLVASVKDVTVGFGKTTVASELPIAAQTDVVAGFKRAARGREAAGSLIERLSVQDTKQSGVDIGRLTLGSSEKLETSTSFKHLANYGDIVTEVSSRVEGRGSILNTARELPMESYQNANIGKDISEILYGKQASIFEKAASGFSEKLGTERVIKSGGATRTNAGITPLSKTFGKNRGVASARESGKNGLKLLQAGATPEYAKTEARATGSILDELIRRSSVEQTSAKAESAQGHIPTPTNTLAPSYGNPRFFSEEEPIYYRDIPGMERPTPKTRSRSEISIMAISQESSTRMGSAFESVLGNIGGVKQESTVEQQSRRVNDILSGMRSKQKTNQDTYNKVFEITKPIMDVRSGQESRYNRAIDLTTRQEQKLDQVQARVSDITTVRTPVSERTTVGRGGWEYRPWEITTGPYTPIFPLGGAGGGGGGGGGGGSQGGRSTRKKNYTNPVVDIAYLSNLFQSGSLERTPHRKGSSAPVRLLTGQLRASAKAHPKKGKK